MARDDWQVWDHGSEAVEQFWRKLLQRPEYRRHASLGGAIPSDAAHYVPDEFTNKMKLDPDLDTTHFPPSFFICEAIWEATP